MINIDLNDSKAKIKVPLVGYIAVQPCPTVQRDTKQNTEQYNVASKCPNMQLGNITDSETHLVDNMLYPVVNARTEPGCPDRSSSLASYFLFLDAPPTLSGDATFIM